MWSINPQNNLLWYALLDNINAEISKTSIIDQVLLELRLSNQNAFPDELVTVEFPILAILVLFVKLLVLLTFAVYHDADLFPLVQLPSHTTSCRLENFAIALKRLGKIKHTSCAKDAPITQLPLDDVPTDALDGSVESWLTLLVPFVIPQPLFGDNLLVE